ncbi:MAG: SIMPL domain-containing protein [Chloroflexi bacterium]|nr:SIMPL domain-containing protein [Chloroflexota bacterium]
MSHVGKLWRSTRRLVLAPFVLLTACITVNPAVSTEPTPVPTPIRGTISVMGDGKVTALPDLATALFQVQEQQPTAQEAYAVATKAITKALATLASLGVTEKDVRTQQFSVNPVYISQRVEVTSPEGKKVETFQSVLVGYQATNQLTAKLRDLKNMGSILDKVVDATEGKVRVTGVSFSLDDPIQYEAEARAKALKDAVAKAELMAQLSGVKLLKATSVNESFFKPGPVSYQPPFLPAPPFPGPVPTPTPSVAFAAVPLAPGELEVGVTVTITYVTE